MTAVTEKDTKKDAQACTSPDTFDDIQSAIDSNSSSSSESTESPDIFADYPEYDPYEGENRDYVPDDQVVFVEPSSYYIETTDDIRNEKIRDLIRFKHKYTLDTNDDDANKKLNTKIIALVKTIDDDFDFNIDAIPVRSDIIANIAHERVQYRPSMSVIDKKAFTSLIFNEANAALDNWNKVLLLNAILRERYPSPSIPPLKYSFMTSVEAEIIIELILCDHHIIKIAPTGVTSNPDNHLLAVYDDDPESPKYGTYHTNYAVIRKLMMQYVNGVDNKVLEVVRNAIYDRVETRTLTEDASLCPFNDCVYNYETGEHLPFSKDYVFIAKQWTNLPKDEPPMPTYVDPEDGFEWTPISQINSTFTSDNGDFDAESSLCIFQMMGAVMRPKQPWKKCGLFIASDGNNGKGTIVQMIREVVGSDYHTSIPMADFQKRFNLGTLQRVNAVLVDENDVNDFMKSAAQLKAVITGDVITIEEKHIQPVDFQFRGFMIQCLNARPKSRDNTDSFYRRFTVVKFPNCYTGKERKYIKDDYIKRREVREYLAWYVMKKLPKYYDIVQPETGKAELDEIKRENNSVEAFYDDIITDLQSLFLPSAFLYEVYKAWYITNMAKTGYVSMVKFTEKMDDCINSDPEPPYRRVTEKKIVRGRERIVSKQVRLPHVSVLHEPSLKPLENKMESWAHVTRKGLNISGERHRGYEGQ